MSKNQKNILPYSVSQNFLTSSQTIRRLIRIAGLRPDDTVLEIGAGKGHITRALAERCARVISYEIDGKLYARLKETLPENAELHNGDFLSARLPREPYKVFANIPFCITTDIIRKLTQTPNPPEEIWLILEKGAAKRFCGKPGESLNSLLLRPFFDAKILYHFRREDFHPAPRTDVVMMALLRKGKPDLLPNERTDFEAFLRHSFLRGLFGKGALLSKRQIAAALRLEGLPPVKPGDDVLYVQWLCLFRCWLRLGKPMR